MSELKEGTKLRTIFWSDTDGGEVIAGKHGCKSLTVVMEHGQMSMVPWCLQVNEDGKRFMHNLALCEGAVLEDLDACLVAEEPDTDEDVTLDDLRAVSKHHPVREESIDPEPGWPEGWS